MLGKRCKKLIASYLEIKPELEFLNNLWGQGTEQE
jgi:hypothetical protein